MSDTENVTGDVNQPVNDESVSQNELQGGITENSSQDSAVEKHEPRDVTNEAVESENAEAKVPENDNKQSEKQGEEQQPSFDGLGLPENVLAAVKKVGFEVPSPIQAETIPVLMEGHDVVGLAQTGTGKTAAFALPILSRIDVSKRHPQALVLAPTRELALQVAESFQSFSEHLGGIHVLPIYGGQAYGVQLSGLRRGAHIVVGTPGRVIDHLEKGSLDISELRFMVLDEADEMLNMGFQEDCLLYTSPSPRDS